LDLVFALYSVFHSYFHAQQHSQRFTGFLQFASQVVPTSRAFLRALYDFSSEFKTLFTRRRISKAAHEDIESWLRFASDWNGVRLFSPSRPILHVYTDASGRKGLGGQMSLPVLSRTYSSQGNARRHPRHPLLGQ
jgi:hypothetical protein